jgi:hypothetical protein
MGAMSVVTIPLKTEKWQSDALVKRFEICRQIYNSMLGYELKKLREMERRPEYKQAKEVIANAYKNMEPAERKKDADFKAACQTKNDLMKEYRFSKMGFVGDTTSFYKHFNMNIPSEVAGNTIAPAMWAAFDDYFFGSGRQIKFKRKGEWYSMVSQGKSGIRIVDDDWEKVRGNANGRKLYCVYSTAHGKTIKMPLKLDPKDYYKLEMLDLESYKQVRIINKEVRGTLKWYVQITIDKAPVTKYDKDGNEKNPINKGKVGMYIDTSHVVYTSDGETFTDISLEDTDTDIYYDTKIKALQQYLDNSRRAMNPENFNEDGTCKKGIYFDGNRYRLKWNFSNGYHKAVAELRDLHRVQAENRKLERIAIANEILSHGNMIMVNDYPFQAAAMRKKETENENEKKSKAGYSVGHNAPAMLVTLIETKLASADSGTVVKLKIKDIDRSENDYRQRYAREMYLALK